MEEWIGIAKYKCIATNSSISSYVPGIVFTL